MELMKNIWKNRYQYAHLIALVATALNVVGILSFWLMGGTNIGDFIGALSILLGVVLAFCAYCLGGLWTAIKVALNIGVWGWRVIPFPYDIVTGFAAFIAGIVILILIPIIPVRRAMQEYETQRYIARQAR